MVFVDGVDLVDLADEIAAVLADDAGVVVLTAVLVGRLEDRIVDVDGTTEDTGVLDGWEEGVVG